jgi:hypothetical protein
MKTIKEKAVEQAFIRVMNRLIGSRDAFIPQDIYTEEEYTLEQLGVRIEELKCQMMSLANTKFGDKEYTTLPGEIDLTRERMQRLKGQQAERALRAELVQELQDYLMTKETNLTKFDEEIFRRVVERVKVRSMVEVEFVFKAGVEVREILE